MTKVLRSLIHEKFPLDLRVKIELLSRRRDLTNKEKQEEIFNLLREFKVEGITQLGPGTNRYAFKIDGFVVKVATDHDGKIDNLKEFKMAKRLYPHVTKTYEVSENGTLLVAEYIQPFTSYTEMSRYADKIREILSNLSSVYLIGDVGVTPKNFANWGLRVGSDEPVCLDFAYVYEVSSELFVCRECKNHSMLVPNKDFTELICPAPNCGHRYLFEDIRRRIGNDLHRHEIGDLREEGYVMWDSNVPTELTNNRSNYLGFQKKRTMRTPVQQEESQVEEIDFQLEHEPAYYLKEGIEMDNNVIRNAAEALAAGAMFTRPVIRGTARIPEAAAADAPGVIRVTGVARPVTPIQPPAELEESGLAFSGNMDELDTPTSAQVVFEQAETKDPVEEPEEQEDIPVVTGNATVLQRPDEEFDIPDPATIQRDPEPVVVKGTSEPAVINEEPPANPEPPVQEAPAVSNQHVFTESFIHNMKLAVSKISNRIADELRHQRLYDDVRDGIRDKRLFADPYYKEVQNAVFRSLVQYLNFTQVELPNTNRPGVHKEWIPSEDLVGAPYEPTLIFLERFWTIREINDIDNSVRALRRYHDMFSDYPGIQREWLPVLNRRMGEKMKLDSSATAITINTIADMWCVPKEEEPAPDEPITDPGAADAIAMTQAAMDAVEEMAKDEANGTQDQTLKEKLQEEIGSPIPAKDITPDMVQQMLADAASTGIERTGHVPSMLEYLAAHPADDDDDDQEEDSGLAFSGSVGEEDGEEEEDEDEEELEIMSVEIYPDDNGFDVIRLCTGEEFGNICLPFYTHLEKVDLRKPAPPSMADDRNGKWDWLIHFTPNIMYRTRRPEYWLEMNDVDKSEEDRILFAILDVDDNGDTIMGVYGFQGIYVIDDNGIPHSDFNDELIQKLNRIFIDGIASTPISHYRRTVARRDLVQDEQYVNDFVIEEKETDDMEDETFQEAEDAAIAAMTANMQPATTQQQRPAQPVVNNAQQVAQRPVVQPQQPGGGNMIFAPIHKTRQSNG